MIPTELVDRQRQAQQDLVTLAVRDINAVWRDADPSDAAAATEQLIPPARAVTAAYGDVAAVMGAEFYDEARAAAEAPGTFRAIAGPVAPTDQVDAMVRWAVGPLWSATPDVEAALARLRGGTTRLVRQPERRTVWQATRDDPASPRYARVPRHDACDFCLMLASRGGVYLSEDSAARTEAGLRYHDHCQCTPMPVWDDDDLLDVHLQLADEWQRVASRAANPRAVWRRHIEDTRPHQHEPRPD